MAPKGAPDSNEPKYSEQEAKHSHSESSGRRVSPSFNSGAESGPDGTACEEGRRRHREDDLRIQRPQDHRAAEGDRERVRSGGDAHRIVPDYQGAEGASPRQKEGEGHQAQRERDAGRREGNRPQAEAQELRENFPRIRAGNPGHLLLGGLHGGQEAPPGRAERHQGRGDHYRRRGHLMRPYHHLYKQSLFNYKNPKAMKRLRSSSRTGTRTPHPLEVNETLLQELTDLLSGVKNNTEIKSVGLVMKEKFAQFHALTLQHKKNDNAKSLAELEERRDRSFQLIDDCFTEIIKKLTKRQQELKDQYADIISREHRRLKELQTSLDQEYQRSRQLLSNSHDFIVQFDSGIDFSANKGALSQLFNDFKLIYDVAINKTGIFFEASAFKNPVFSIIRNDIARIQNLGGIIDKRAFPHPIVAFNTTSLETYEFIQSSQKWVKRQLYDDTETLFAKLPKYFKSLYIGNDSFLLVGGYDPVLNATSQKCYQLLGNGTVKNFPSLRTPRQYFSMAYDPEAKSVFCIGGFNNYQNVLGTAEVATLDGGSRWEYIEELNMPRLNAAACRVGKKYTYVFGGRNEASLLDSIERYNADYNIWNLLNLVLPCPVSNLYALPLPHAHHHVLILGGLKEAAKSGGKKEQFQIQEHVYLLKESEGVWVKLRDFPYKKKLGAAVMNGQGKVFTQVFNNNSELPEVYPYDLRKYYPQFDQYYMQDLIRKKRERQQEIQPSDLRGGRELIVAEKGRVRAASRSWDRFSQASVISKASVLKGKKPPKINNQIEMIEMGQTGVSDTGGERNSSPTPSESRTFDDLRSVTFTPSFVQNADLESRTVRSEISNSWMPSTTQ